MSATTVSHTKIVTHQKTTVTDRWVITTVEESTYSNRVLITYRKNITRVPNTQANSFDSSTLSSATPIEESTWVPSTPTRQPTPTQVPGAPMKKARKRAPRTRVPIREFLNL